MEKSLLSGSTALLVLKLLEDGPMYGYQMMESLRGRSGNVFELKAGTLYPLLHTLENRGFVESYYGEGGSGRERKYYRLRPEGLEELKRQSVQWQQYRQAMEKILGGAFCGTC